MPRDEVFSDPQRPSGEVSPIWAQGRPGSPPGPTRKQGRNVKNWNDKWINVTFIDPKWGGSCCFFKLQEGEK